MCPMRQFIWHSGHMEVIMDIRITQTYPKIGIQTQNAKLELSNCGKTDFTINHTEPKLELHTTQAKVYIDQSRCFADEGLKGIKDLMDDMVSQAQAQAFQYIAKKAEEGDSYARIENGGKPILDAMKQDLYQTVDYNIGLMPTQGPEITVEPGEVETNLIRGEVNATFNYVPIEGAYTPGKVSFDLLQKGSVEIEYVGKNIDTKL